MPAGLVGLGRSKSQSGTETNMKYIIALFLVSLSALAADTPVAIVRGTNVLGTAIIDPARFTPPPGASNIVITADEAGVIAKGWRYVGGVFLKPDGSPIANGDKTRIDRAILIRDTISDFRTALANWDTLTAAQQKAVLKRCVQVLVAMLKERPELIAIKEEQ